MTIAVLCYSTCEVDIIRNVPDFKTEEEVDNFLFGANGVCQYNPSEVSFMYPVGGQDMRINNLTPDDFGWQEAIMNDELDDIYEDEEPEEEYQEEYEDTRCDNERYPFDSRFYEDGRFL